MFFFFKFPGIELSKVYRPTKHIIGHIGDGNLIFPQNIYI